MAAVLASHRNPKTMEWLQEPQFEVERDPIPSAVPPWWNLKYKKRIYTQHGYSNAGHTYGSALPESDKVALLEYLKTL